MAPPDEVTVFFNKGYNEARALYEDDKLDEAIEKAEALLKDEGIVSASAKEATY